MILELAYLPPSENELKTPLVIRGQARLVKSASARDFERRVAADVQASGNFSGEPLDGALVLHCTFTFPSIASDVSNRIKALEDALTAAGVWHDDKQVTHIHAEKLIGEPRTRIEVLPDMDAQPELVERLETSASKRRRQETAKRQVRIAFDFGDDGPECHAVSGVRRFR